MAVGDITEVTVKALHFGAEYVNVTHYETQTSFGNKDLELLGLIDAIEEFWFNKILTVDVLDLVHTQMSFKEIQLRDVNNPTVGLDHVVASGTNGKLAGEILPQQTCALFQKRTSKIGRSYSGRMYLGGATEAVQNAGTWSTAYLDDLSAWFAQIINIFNSTITFTFRQVVWSRKLQVASPVTSYGVNTRTRTQRRRNV